MSHTTERTASRSSKPSNRLSGTDWTDAALAAMAEAGTAGVNVEQLARRLGTTKGSFYHHFDNRQALLEAAIGRWEQIVEADIAESRRIDDIRARLLAGALGGIDTALDGFVDLALAASIHEPLVAEAVARVNSLRIEWLCAAITEAGFDGDEAHDRALRGLSGYVGIYLLQRMLGETFDRAEVINQLTALVDDILRP